MGVNRGSRIVGRNIDAAVAGEGVRNNSRIGGGGVPVDDPRGVNGGALPAAARLGGDHEAVLRGKGDARRAGGVASSVSREAEAEALALVGGPAVATGRSCRLDHLSEAGVGNNGAHQRGGARQREACEGARRDDGGVAGVGQLVAYLVGNLVEADADQRTYRGVRDRRAG